MVTAENVWGHYEETIVNRLREQAIPFLVVMNKTESSVASKDRLPDAMRGLPMVRASAKTAKASKQSAANWFGCRLANRFTKHS